MNERVVYFGPERNLLGVLTLPGEPHPGAPAIILLNAGLLHRVGPNRLSVEIARRLAARGYPSFRFDMAGVGDSELGEGGTLYIERSRQDVVESMDALQEMIGADRFVVMGLCTGAYNAFRAALVDDRVAGCALMDGYSYPTARSQFEHYRSRILEVERWKRYIARRLGDGADNEGVVQGDLVVFENEHVSKERFATELATLVDRGVQLLLIYTGLGPLRYTYRRQLHDAFPTIDLDRAAIVHFYPEADHTFTLPGHRETLLTHIDAWIDARFAGATAS
jgi:pimeloyl-ACP methyl ester carboxylesterase